jgi:hypothetical protein
MNNWNKYTVKKWWLKSDENDESFILIWLGFQMFTNSLKSFISAPVRLIDKRGLICDHSQLINISLNFRRTLFIFWENICLLFSVESRRGRFSEF